MKIKLSPSQLNVLLKLKRGETLHFIMGLNSRWFFNTGRSINCRTIFKLEDLDFIQRDNERYPRFEVLTDKGRAYLDEISQTTG